MTVVLVVASVAAASAVLAWLGFQVPPRPLRPTGPSSQVGEVVLPTDLPSAVGAITVLPEPPDRSCSASTRWCCGDAPG